MKVSNEIESVLLCFVGELENAEKKHPNWPVDPVHAAAIVNEEAGELIRAALNYNYENKPYFEMTDEAIQVGAMALRFLLNIHKLEKVIPPSIVRKEAK